LSPRRRRRQARPPASPAAAAAPQPGPQASALAAAQQPAGFWSPLRSWLAVFSLLALHATLAVSSLVRENPTVDEVAHMPAGISYWQKGTFKLYHHNPPLIKLVAALPVVWSHPRTAASLSSIGLVNDDRAVLDLYQMLCWTSPAPDQSSFGYYFSLINADRYFELFTRARLLMPAFSVLGGLVVFLWSRRLYGPAGGLLSLALWCLCPNILAHARLVTTDVGATALGVAATYVFWLYLQRPTWRRAAAAGLCLGLAELAKFSMILLYGLWPVIWLVLEVARWQRQGWRRRLARSLAQGLVIVALSLFTIDAGYGAEGVGLPLGDRHLEFASSLLTGPVVPGKPRPSSPNPLLKAAWRERENRFRGTSMASFPSPLPLHYLLGFDEQKLESEGVPKRWFPPKERASIAESDEVTGYPVYLDGQLRRTGWRSYYFWAAVYKVPEGTWVLVLLTLGVLAGSPRARAAWSDELVLLIVPLAILFTMSYLTDINLGLRYILPVFPYLFISAGKLARWVAGFAVPLSRLAAGSLVGSALAATALATFSIHPHYLAYFNWTSGGPAEGSRHLIDSNLDWGQDLVNLRDWVATHTPGERIGLAYFGQITPVIFGVRNEPFDWFLPPGRPGTLGPRTDNPSLVGPARQLTPGLYAVSATLLRGLPWRLYDPNPLVAPQAWGAKEFAFSYFQEVEPIDHVGYSIFIYRLTAADVARLSPLVAQPP